MKAAGTGLVIKRNIFSKYLVKFKIQPALSYLRRVWVMPGSVITGGTARGDSTQVIRGNRGAADQGVTTYDEGREAQGL